MWLLYAQLKLNRIPRWSLLLISKDGVLSFVLMCLCDYAFRSCVEQISVVHALGDSRRANARNRNLSQNARLVSPRVLTAALGACDAAAAHVAVGAKDVQKEMEQQGM